MGAFSDGFLGGRGKPWVEVGEVFDARLAEKLASQEGVDAFGEHRRSPHEEGKLAVSAYTEGSPCARRRPPSVCHFGTRSAATA